MLLLIDNYDSFTYNLYQYLCELGEQVEVVRNDAQWFDIHRTRPREQETALLDRADTIRAATRAWIATLTAADLLAYGNHPERGVVQLDNRIDQIARHDREHAAQLRAMADAARVADATTGGGGDAAATR